MTWNNICKSFNPVPHLQAHSHTWWLSLSPNVWITLYYFSRAPGHDLMLSLTDVYWTLECAGTKHSAGAQGGHTGMAPVGPSPCKGEIYRTAMVLPILLMRTEGLRDITEAGHLVTWYLSRALSLPHRMLSRWQPGGLWQDYSVGGAGSKPEKRCSFQVHSRAWMLI